MSSAKVCWFTAFKKITLNAVYYLNVSINKAALLGELYIVRHV